MSPRSASGIGAMKALPLVREHFRHAELIVPVELRPGQRVDAAQHQLADPLRMRLGIGQRQRRAPRAAEHQPFVEAGHLAQPLDVGDEMPGRVGLEAGVRRRLAAAALVEQDDVVELRIEQPPLLGRDGAARPAMQEHRRLGALGADAFPVDDVAVADIEHAASRTARSRDRACASALLILSCLDQAAIGRCRVRVLVGDEVVQEAGCARHPPASSCPAARGCCRHRAASPRCPTGSSARSPPDRRRRRSTARCRPAPRRSAACRNRRKSRASTKFDDWNFFGAPRVQVELGAAHRNQRLVEIAARLLAHAAMADRGVAERALDAEAHRAALAAAGIDAACCRGSSPSPRYAGSWQTASTLLPSGSKTKAP